VAEKKWWVIQGANLQPLIKRPNENKPTESSATQAYDNHEDDQEKR